MKTFNLTLAAVAIAAVASTSAFATSFDSRGNIPNHNADAVASYTDSFAPVIDQTTKPAGALSQNDAAVLQIRTTHDVNGH